MNLAGLLRSGLIFLATLGLAWSQTVPSANSSPNSSKDAPVRSDQGLKPAAALSDQGPDPLLDLPRLKQSRASLIGGTLGNIDRLRGRFILRLFGGGKLTIVFDPRTQFVHEGKAANAQDMHAGDRVYVETVLDGTAVFAKTIHVFTGAAQGTTVGQIIAYDAAQGSLSIRDQLSSRPVQFHVTSKTIITGAGVGPGALVQVSFVGGKGPALVREIVVLAAPGSVFTFAGRITFLDFASHELVLASATDNRYEIQFNPATIEADAREHLQEGASVTVAARFNGQRYVAESVTVLPHSME
ncbi:MAG: hypothetical protein ACXVZH_16065 [Terriglobales bacterium]